MSLLNPIINYIFPLKTIYIRLSKNQIELKHIESGNSLVRKSDLIFSNDRLLIADFDAFEFVLRGLIKELSDKKGSSFLRSFKVVFQTTDTRTNYMTPTELRIYQDSLFFSGAKEIFISKENRRLSDDEVINITKQKNND